MIFPVILAGGKGERFWPFSNKKHPKQLLPLVTNKTMLEDTLAHIKKLKTKAPTHIIVSQNLVKPIAKLVGKRKDIILIGEPEGKNTAPAIALASQLIAQIDPKGVMVVLTADHAISPTPAFIKSIKAAAQLASKSETLVTFGISTTRPEVGYGYVETDKSLGEINGLSCHRVKKFHEKPKLSQAKKYHQSKKYYWNSGMFAWNVSYLWKLFAEYQPDIYKAFEKQGAMNPQSPSFSRKLKATYKLFAGESIDYGIMENAPEIAMVVPDYQWDDIGSWTALDRRNKTDKDQNIFLGESVHLETKNITAFADKGLIATYGVKDLLIVQHDGVTLVVHKDKRADLKKLVEEVKKKAKLSQYL